MYSGIVESVGVVKAIASFGVERECRIAAALLDDICIGESISVNGVCLTATKKTSDCFSAVISSETLRKTNLKDLAVNQSVNVERSLKMGSRNSGHMLQGHVEGVGVIDEIKAGGEKSLLVKINTLPDIAKYIVSKGFVAIDGMSITAIDVGDDWFTVTFIPHTQSVTIIQHYRPGCSVNIEVDILGKYVEKFMRRVEK